jgi:uncharacterized phage protein (TIGR01671 family)
MREIKFRAWDKFNGVMTYQKNNSFTQRCLFFREMADYEHSGNGIEYMQFTGLKDKDGKEVYEGDILRYCDNWQFPDPEDTSHHLIFWDEENARFWDKRLEDGDSLSAYLDQSIEWVSETKVIGNQYANPELNFTLR